MPVGTVDPDERPRSNATFDLIQLQNISLAFGGQTLFDDLTWSIKPGYRTGLIGPNGAGKSTVLKLIVDEVTPDAGTVVRGGTSSVGYLKQDVQEKSSDDPVVSVAMEAFKNLEQLQIEETRITKELDKTDHTKKRFSKLLEDLDRIHVDLNSQEAHLARPRAEAVLMGLGFSETDLERPLSTFSGGWRMRVALAKLLLQQPSYLLLDEPTNHLDIDSIDWLESYLQNYDGSVVIVSHDRYFLDRMVNYTAELTHGRIVEYAGNYSFYLEERKERLAHHKAAYENQQREIAQTERFIERFRAKASKARQVQSKVKTLDRLERIPPPDDNMDSIAFRFPEPERSGKVVASLSKFSKTYETEQGDVEVFKTAGPLTIERGDKVALIGINGAGKSTLARILNGDETFDGTLELGYNVTRTFFAQHQADTLNKDFTVLKCLEDVARGHSETELRSILGAFLFSGDDVNKRVSVLSGGEKSRVALARTLLKPSNFLILDEPTNHLDIQSIGVLVEALRQYSGTFIVVSHDRHFLDQVTNKVVRVGYGGLRSFLGNFSDYKWQVEHGTASKTEHVATPENTAKRNSKNDAPDKSKADERDSGRKSREQKRREAQERQQLAKMIQSDQEIDISKLSHNQLEKLYRKTEQRIFKAERKQRKYESELSSPEVFEDLQAARKLTAEYEKVKEDLDGLYRQWENIAERLESPAAS